MIDISCERVVSLTAATHLLPTRRRNARPNVATLYRWTSEGVRGIVLESLMVGGTPRFRLQLAPDLVALAALISLTAASVQPPLGEK